MPEALTSIERRIYNYLIDHLKKETYQPSVREICAEFGIRSTKTVTEHLQSLQRKGYLDRTPSRSRALHILGLNLSPRTYTIPVYGNSHESAEPTEMAYDLDRALACSADCFLVRVEGSHLQKFSVEDGDLILVEPRDELSAGDLIVIDREGAIDLQRKEAVGAGSLAGDGTGRGNGATSPRVLGRAGALLRTFG